MKKILLTIVLTILSGNLKSFASDVPAGWEEIFWGWKHSSTCSTTINNSNGELFIVLLKNHMQINFTPTHKFHGCTMTIGNVSISQSESEEEYGSYIFYPGGTKFDAICKELSKGATRIKFTSGDKVVSIPFTGLTAKNFNAAREWAKKNYKDVE